MLVTGNHCLDTLFLNMDLLTIDEETNYDDDNMKSRAGDVLWSEKILKVKSATPTVIRRGLCLVQQDGK